MTVLGLGRMGRAVADRLTRKGVVTTGWSRSGVVVSGGGGVRSAQDPAEAVTGADVVLLALYDAEACRTVLNRSLGHMEPDCVLVNLSTVAPAEAAELDRTARAAGRRYVHCPVLGSVPAVESGTLTLLSGDRDLPATAEQVLPHLGRILPCGDARSAAALKLVANGALADTVVAVGTALARGARLALDHTTVLDVLQATALGALVTTKRAGLEGAETATTFAAGALAKDMDLLAGIDPASRPLARTLQAAGASHEEDIAAICAGLGAGTPRLVDASSHLYARPGICTDEELLRPLISYARGHATGDPGHFRDAFRPTAHVEGLRGGGFVSWNIAAYCENFTGEPADDEVSRTRTVTELEAAGSVAHATMLLEHGADTFTDMFLLVRGENAWRIANKVYDRTARHSRPA